MIVLTGKGIFWILLSFFLLPGFLNAQSSNLKMDCTECHNDSKFNIGFNKSVHNENGCTSCHRPFQSIDKHISKIEKPLLISCGKCHNEIEKEYSKNFHYLYEDFKCQDCHYEIHSLKKKQQKDSKIAIVKNCTKCHENEDYAASDHSAAAMKGNKDSAVCSDCHGLHDTRVYHTSLETNTAEAREFYSRKCISCHSDAEMMKRNKLSHKTVEYYEETYHGKVQDLGYPTRVAGCADCHTNHNILPPDNPDSTINPKNLVRNCGKCHSGFHQRFAEFKAHPDYKNKNRYPSLYWSFISMVFLLLITFSFFWMHTLLWWRKVYWEKYKLEKLGIVPESPLPHEEAVQEIKRFSGKERIMHMLLIISFFGLVITGFPLKYHGTPWAKALISFMGGAHKAGLYHRFAAVILIGLFLYTIWRGISFIFSKGSGRSGWRGWIDRLFGPDSLMPNKNDWPQFKGMVKWFFGRGDMPQFGRWTYWEKFDFLAVFWGMFIIGGSGITLWAPEAASYIYPGWVLNIASIVHSEEALLAALFIFTVHFFNTHLIPTKFPMDPIIFTGRQKLEELRRFRSLEYERLKNENRLDELKIEHPCISMKIFASMFGLASLWLGIIFTIILLWTFFFA
ncbi:MAG: cytochrome C [Proteobacteria bacterium]|nr:cytochrome C [Pseudomonadota bacterium]